MTSFIKSRFDASYVIKFISQGAAAYLNLRVSEF